MLTAKNMRVDGTLITLEIEDKGRLTVDFSLWEDLVFSIGGISNIRKVKLLGDMLEFPNDIHVEIADFVLLAEKQQKVKLPALASASLINALKKVTGVK